MAASMRAYCVGLVWTWVAFRHIYARGFGSRGGESQRPAGIFCIPCHWIRNGGSDGDGGGVLYIDLHPSQDWIPNHQTNSHPTANNQSSHFFLHLFPPITPYTQPKLASLRTFYILGGPPQSPLASSSSSPSIPSFPIFSSLRGLLLHAASTLLIPE